MFAHSTTRVAQSFPSIALVAALVLAGCGKQAPAPAEQTASGDPKAMSAAELTAGTANSAATTNPANPASTVAAPPASAEPFDENRFARVVSVQPLHGPQQVCSDQTVTTQRPQEDRHQVAGTVIGAVAGGLIGNKFGRGRGRKLTTVGGAVAGGIVGKNIQESHQANDTVTRVEQRCHTVTPDQNGQLLFDVTYAYQGQNLHVKLDHDPGDRIALPVRGVE